MYVSFLQQKLVKNNKDVLASLRNSFDKQEQSLELVRQLKSKYKETLNGKAIPVPIFFETYTQKYLTF